MKNFYVKEIWDEKKNRRTRLTFRIGKWKASDYVGDIKDKIYILPSLCLYFNSSEIYVCASWLVFEAMVFYTDFTKKRI